MAGQLVTENWAFIGTAWVYSPNGAGVSTFTLSGFPSRARALDAAHDWRAGFTYQTLPPTTDTTVVRIA